MSQKDFEDEYCKKSDMTSEEYHRYFATLPCHCGEEGCKGWACVCNNELSIKNHLKLYS